MKSGVNEANNSVVAVLIFFILGYFGRFWRKTAVLYSVLVLLNDLTITRLMVKKLHSKMTSSDMN